MKRYRASLYFDIQADNEEEARKIADELVDFTSQPEYVIPPLNYYNPYIGGVAELVSGDLLGNAKRLESI